MVEGEEHRPSDSVGDSGSGVLVAEGSKEPGLEAAYRAQPRLGDQLVARAESVVQRAAGCATALGDATDAGGAWATFDDQIPRGIEEFVGVMHRGTGHADLL